MEDFICSAKKKGRDLTVDSLKVAGKFPVRDVIVLVPKDVKRKIHGQYEFTLSYRVNNEGYMGSRDFENIAYFNDKAVSRQQGLSLGPNESKVLTDDEVALDIKDGVFLVRIDAFSKITEDDETNNDISAKLLFKNFDKSSSNEPDLHIEKLRIAKKAPIQGHIRLSKKDAVDQKKGRYGFPVEYVIRNYGNGNAVGFDNLFSINGKGFFRQPNCKLKAGDSKLVKKTVYFPVKNGKLSLKADSNDKFSKYKSRESKQNIDVHLYFRGFN